MFSDSQVKDAIQFALNKGMVSIPDNRRVAFVTHLDLERGGEAKAAFAVRIGKEWQVDSLIDWSHDEGTKAGVNVAWSK